MMMRRCVATPFIAILLAGCVNSAPPLARSLPAAPAIMQPVAVPPLTAGQDARSALARHRGALTEANGRLTASRAWYEGVRRSIAEGR